MFNPLTWFIDPVMNVVDLLNGFGKEYWGLLLVLLVLNRALSNIRGNVRQLRQAHIERTQRLVTTGRHMSRARADQPIFPTAGFGQNFTERPGDIGFTPMNSGREVVRRTRGGNLKQRL